MKCNDYKTLISAHIDGELTPSEERRLMKHIVECSECRKQLESMKVLSDRLTGMHRFEVDIGERNRLISAVHDVMDKEPVTPIAKPILTKPRLVWASAVVVALIIIAALISYPKAPVTPFGEPDMFIPEQDFARFEQVFVEGMAEYLEQERIYATGSEIFSEPVLAVYKIEPPPPAEGYFDDAGDKPQPTGS